MNALMPTVNAAPAITTQSCLPITLGTWHYQKAFTPLFSAWRLANAITAAVTKAAPNYMPLAHQANAAALYTYPGSGIPFGPYKIKEKQL